MFTIPTVMLLYYLLLTVGRGHHIAHNWLHGAVSAFIKIIQILSGIEKKNTHRTAVAFVSFHLIVFCVLFILSEIEKFQGSDGKKEDEEKKYLDVISNKNIKLSERVLIPVKQYPKVLHVACCLLSVCLCKTINVLVFICLFLIKM